MRKVVIVCLAAFSCAAAEPLPKNAGFETPNAKGGGAAGWALYSNGMWSVLRGEGRNGTSALICSDVGKGGWTTQWVEVEPGRTYRVEGWVRTEGVEGSGVCIDFSWHDAYGTRIGTAGTQPRVMGTTAWTKVSLEAFVPPAAAKRCLIGTPVTGNTKGKAWFDDLRIVPIDRPPIGSFISSAYRNRAAEGPVTFHVSLNAKKGEIEAKGYQGRLVLPSGRTLAVPATEEDMACTVDLALLPLGESKVMFEILDRSGKKVDGKSLTFTRTEKPETKGVRIDARGITRIDGKALDGRLIALQPVECRREKALGHCNGTIRHLGTHLVVEYAPTANLGGRELYHHLYRPAEVSCLKVARVGLYRRLFRELRHGCALLAVGKSCDEGRQRSVEEFVQDLFALLALILFH